MTSALPEAKEEETTTSALPEAKESLWMLVASPVAWALHLMASYGTAAVFCAKTSIHASLSAPRIAIAIFTVVALAIILVVGVRGYRRHRLGGSPPPHDADTPEDRHRFLGFSTLLLSGLSAIAVVYQALPALFIGSCR